MPNLQSFFDDTETARAARNRVALGIASALANIDVSKLPIELREGVCAARDIGRKILVCDEREYDRLDELVGADAVAEYLFLLDPLLLWMRCAIIGGCPDDRDEARSALRVPRLVWGVGEGIALPIFLAHNHELGRVDTWTPLVPGLRAIGLTEEGADRYVEALSSRGQDYIVRSGNAVGECFAVPMSAVLMATTTLTRIPHLIEPRIAMAVFFIAQRACSALASAIPTIMRPGSPGAADPQ